jgi:hypothetical protein
VRSLLRPLNQCYEFGIDFRSCLPSFTTTETNERRGVLETQLTEQRALAREVKHEMTTLGERRDLLQRKIHILQRMMNKNIPPLVTADVSAVSGSDDTSTTTTAAKKKITTSSSSKKKSSSKTTSSGSRAAPKRS